MVLRNCPHCKKLEKLKTEPEREFILIKGKKKNTLICSVCGMKVYLKKKSYFLFC